MTSCTESGEHGPWQKIVGEDKTTYVCLKCDGFYMVTAAERRALIDEEVGRLYGRIGPDGKGERP